MRHKALDRKSAPIREVHAGQVLGDWRMAANPRETIVLFSGFTGA